MSRPRLVALALALLLISGCAGTSDVAGDIRTVSDVTVRLRIDPARTRLGRTVRVSLMLMNNSGRARDLVFDSGDRFDFWAIQDGREVWRHSEAEASVEGATTMELEGQSGTQFAATWTPGRAGTYTLYGEVLARGFQGELSADLVVEES